jgi:drug/metabolite transporter (DMT)-like permease
MPGAALALVVAAALLHALWNLAAKQAGGDRRFAFATACAVGVVWLPAALWFAPAELPRWGGREWAVVTLSAAVHVAYFLTLLRGYREADMTVVYPVARGGGPLVTALGAVLLLGERMGAVGLAGVVAVAAGVFAIAGGPRWLAGGALRDPRIAAGLRWGAATGLLIAAYSVIDGYAIRVLGMGPVLYDYLANVLRVPLLALLVWRGGGGLRSTLREGLRRHGRTVLTVATLGPLAYILVLYAVSLAPLSHVAPAREVSLLFAALLGGRLLGEPDRAWRLAGAACIAAGVAALALG